MNTKVYSDFDETKRIGMIRVRGWVDKLHRAHATSAVLESTGLSFANIGARPHAVTMEFRCTSSANLGRKDKRLSLDIEDDDALRQIASTIADYFSRKPPQ